MYSWSLKAFAPPKLYLIRSDEDAMKDICMQKFYEVINSPKLNSRMEHLKIRARSKHILFCLMFLWCLKKICIG